MLLDNGVDLHSYQPTADDIVKIKGCGMFIYVGGESDERVDDVTAQDENDNTVVIDLLEVLGDAVKDDIGDRLSHAAFGAMSVAAIAEKAKEMTMTEVLLIAKLHRLTTRKSVRLM